MDQTQQIDRLDSSADERLNSEAQSAVKGPETFSNNPFDENYRHQLDMSNPREKEIAEDNCMTPEMVDYFRSAEFAELTRPMDQLNWLLNERGLKEKYDHVFISDPVILSSDDAVGELRYKRLKQFMKEEAPDLMERFEKLWEIMFARAAAVKRGERIIPELPLSPNFGVRKRG